jgi:hypothetical protein
MAPVLTGQPIVDIYQKSYLLTGLEGCSYLLIRHIQEVSTFDNRL